MSFLLRECDVMDGANFFCCPRAVPLTLPDLSLSPIHKLKLLFIVTRKLFRLLFWSTNASQTQKRRQSFVYVRFGQQKPIRISVSFEWKSVNKMPIKYHPNLPFKATSLTTTKTMLFVPNWYGCNTKYCKNHFSRGENHQNLLNNMLLAPKMCNFGIDRKSEFV